MNNITDKVCALYQAMVIIAETKCTPEEVARWAEAMNLEDALTTTHKASSFCWEACNEVVKKREQEERCIREGGAPIHRPTEKSEVVN